MTASGFLIGMISTNPPISSLGLALGRGTLTSIFLVMTVLPQLLILGDTLIERTAITLNIDRKQRFFGRHYARRRTHSRPCIRLCGR